jgi:hypothetical protein
MSYKDLKFFAKLRLIYSKLLTESVFWLDTFHGFIVFESGINAWEFWKGDKGRGFREIFFTQKLF